MKEPKTHGRPAKNSNNQFQQTSEEETTTESSENHLHEDTEKRIKQLEKTIDDMKQSKCHEPILLYRINVD